MRCFDFDFDFDFGLMCGRTLLCRDSRELRFEMGDWRGISFKLFF